jgi:8-oxo-dGTP diphosphatase
MQGYNCIMVFHQNGNLLFCKRRKDPYLGLYNLVGGKIEAGEDGFDAAYRELFEETGISPNDIKLHHMMDFTYYNQDCYVEVYVGHLQGEVVLQEEDHPLEWLNMREDFFDSSRFAGEGNIGHMVEQVKLYGIGKSRIPVNKDSDKKINLNSICIGVDGCKGGWIAAIINHGKLILEKYTNLEDIVLNYGTFDEFLIDMVIGLPSTSDQIRPDTEARKMIKERASTIFPVPCRQAVYAEDISKSYDENLRVLGKKFTPLTVGIMPKMREVDIFLQENNQYKNLIKESHPEVCFAQLNGSTVLSKKAELEGIEERIRILSKFIEEISFEKVKLWAKEFKCNMDDIIDAICLSVSANFVSQGEYTVIPESPVVDETGLLMQMVVPNKMVRNDCLGSKDVV